MTQISPFLTLILCATIPALLIITMIFKKFSTVCYRNVRKNIAELNGFLSENLSGMKVIQSFVQENKKKKEFSKCNQDYKKSNMKQIMLFAIYRPGIYCLYIFTQALIIFVGAKQIISGRLQLKNYVKFYNYIGDFYTPIQNLAEQINELQAAFAAAERIFAMIDMKTDITDGVNAVECENIKGKIEFSHVWFKYGQEDWVLKDISFTVNAGDTCAIVGETGSGKSTILSLLVRNYEIQKGSIYLDGVDITNYKIDSLRKQIGQMLQTVFLFSGSISDNITMLDDTISEQQIKEATSYVCADSFIEKYEDGYDHAIVEKGANLSEGQQQLISFARTIVHSPPIMVLDEATSNIDTETEFIIQKSLDNIKSVGTVLVVAHRLSTIKGANQIIVMNKGRISEFGNHNELINKRGIYYRLYQLQW